MFHSVTSNRNNNFLLLWWENKCNYAKMRRESQQSNIANEMNLFRFSNKEPIPSFCLRFNFKTEDKWKWIHHVDHDKKFEWSKRETYCKQNSVFIKI